MLQKKCFILASPWETKKKERKKQTKQATKNKQTSFYININQFKTFYININNNFKTIRVPLLLKA